MSILKVHNRKLRLSKTQQAMLERSLRDLVSGSPKQHTKELNERFRRRRRFGHLLEAELRRVGFDVEKLRRGFDVEKLRRFANQESARLDKAFVARVKGRRERGGRRSGGHPDAVLGLTSVSANPPYDFTWTNHNIIGPYVSTQFLHTANPNTGYLSVYGRAQNNGRPRQVESFAGLGFWYIPNQVGVLTVSIAPPTQEYGFIDAGWSDVASSAGWISLAIVSHQRTGPGFPEVRVVDTDVLWGEIVYWFEDITHNQNRPAYSMSVSTLVDTSHNYACQAWIKASAYAQNGGASAFSRVAATVGSFTHNFVGVEQVVAPRSE